MEKKNNKRPRLEKLIPNEPRRSEIPGRLYQGDPILGDGGIFTDLL